ncbi:MAG TPA: PPOX class F420-dependent oxidoreductase [Actinophytocola sp.]|uniref:PPOX class F420-dependent oxidoreductase n=1 Tax=Actinophytocola sp. TaxID=1872138 RepID=UPI002DDDADFE|nr:PPOX class F420-dependent oxidoreductase [Actinophytocola sp.]HEV2781127.1 PPOX class F420-dependent oxidoreductase [Actinophytocola sp.]
MAKLNDAARRLIESGALGHLVTLNEDGSPQVCVVWVGIDGDELIAGHLDARQRKLANIRRDPRVSLSFEANYLNEVGTRDHLVVHGTARITEGGAPELLQRLAKTYIGPDAVYPPNPDAPPGFITHITPTRITGVGDWAA